MTPIALTDIRLQAVKDAARHPAWRSTFLERLAELLQGKRASAWAARAASYSVAPAT